MVIQITQFQENLKEPTKKDIKELVVALHILDVNRIEYDLKPPKQFKECEKENYEEHFQI